MSNRKGKLIVVSGPSGSGKGTLLHHLFLRNPELRYSISATTRKPRPEEENGVDYYFVSPKSFERAIAAGEMLEWAEYCRNYYGTPESPIRRWIQEGRNVILEIEVEGALQVQKKMPEAKMVFILPPSEQELERRLKERATESDEDTAMRLHTAKKEIDQAGRYQKTIINDDLDQAVTELSRFIEED